MKSFNYHPGRKSILLALCLSAGSIATLAQQDPFTSDPNRAKRPATPQQPAAKDPAAPKADPAVATSEEEVITSAGFAYKATLAGNKEVRMSELAAQRAQDPEIKQLASKLVTDHTRIAQELKTIATAKGFALPVDDAVHTPKPAPGVTDPSSQTPRPDATSPQPQAQPV